MAEKHTETQLKEMTQAELVEIAKNLGEDIDPGEDKDLIVGAILSAQEAGAKKARNAPARRNAPKKDAKKDAKKDEKPDPEERVSVIFHETSAPDGDAPVKLSHNGEAIVAKRGEPVEIKRKYLDGPVKDAVITEFMRDENTGKVRTRNVPRFPYSLA